jgi:predicted TPR repeat methyltransferase
LPDKDGAFSGSDEWVLQRQGRYAHALDYVERAALAAGFAIRTLERQTLRYEADAPVAGLFAVLECARA